MQLYFGLATLNKCLNWINSKGIRGGVVIVDGHNPPWKKAPKIELHANVTLQWY
jgi:hypothetical protein